MDKKKIQEKARDVAKFTYEVIDDIFGRRILIFAYILAAIFAASVIFQVFTKYIYEEGFSTADALVATIVHTFSKIWVGILYGVLPGFGVFVVLYVVAKCIRNKNLKLKAEAEAVRKAEDAKRLEDERRCQEEEEKRAADEKRKAEEMAKLKAQADKARMKAETEAKQKAAEERIKDVVVTTLRTAVDAKFAEESARRQATEDAKAKAEKEARLAAEEAQRQAQRQADEDARRQAELEAKWREEDAARAAKELEELGRLEWESDKMFMDMEIKASVGLVADPDADDGASLKPQQSAPQKFGVANIEIKKKEFRALFTPAFRGNKGKNIDYCLALECVLGDKCEKFSITDLARLALVLHETEGVVAEEMSFPKWLTKFCEALSVNPPLETSKNKYRTDQNIAELYNFANFSKKK